MVREPSSTPSRPRSSCSSSSVLVVAIVLLGVWAVRRFVPSTRDGFDAEVSSQMLGVVASLFGLLLAFVVVIEFQAFSSAGDNVQTEADDLGAIVRDSYAFGPAGVTIRGSIGDYVRTVVDDEFPLMREGKESSAAWLRIDDIFASMQSYKPSRRRRWPSTTTRSGTSTRCSRRGATGSTRAAATICRC